jgi:predicted PurR-regulated permease PerM
MSETPTKPGFSTLATAFFIACFALVGYCLYLIFSPFFSLLIWASLLAVVFHPLFEWNLKWLRGRRSLSAIATCLAILLLIVIPLTVLGILLTRQSIALYHSIQENLGVLGSEASARLQQIQELPLVHRVLSNGMQLLGSGSVDLQSMIGQILTALSRFMVANGPSLLAGAGGLLYQFLMVFILMFFLFRDGHLLIEAVRNSSPLPETYQTEIMSKFRDVSYATFFGSIFTALVQGCAGGLLFWILRIPSPLFWGALIAFASLVPIVGGFLIWVPVSLYFFLIGSVAHGILVLALGGVVVSSIDNVLKPMIIRGRTDMHPILIFLSVLGGIQVFGFLGVLLGPFFVAVFLSFLNFYRLEFHAPPQTTDRVQG